MPLIETAHAVEKYRAKCEDRVDVIHEDQRTVVVVADGAGGTGCGDTAAEYLIREVRSYYKTIHSADDWTALLRQIDNQISIGETTAIVVDIRPYGIAGSSVGDCQALVVSGDTIIDLTEHQVRKPLIGSGDCQPVAFMHPPLAELLIAGTDGLFDYAKREEIVHAVIGNEFYEIPRKCIEMVQLPTGELWDDVGIVVARNVPRRSTRVQYEI